MHYPESRERSIEPFGQLLKEPEYQAMIKHNHIPAIKDCKTFGLKMPVSTNVSSKSVL